MANVIVDLPEVDLKPAFLHEALAGRNERVPPSVALGLISNLEMSRTEQMAFVLETVQNKKVEVLVRAAAVRLFVRFGGESVRSGLLNALGSPEERIAAAAAAVLGQVGTEEHLPALKRVRARKKAGEFYRKRVAFAEALIVHRFGVTGHKVELPHGGEQVAPALGGRAFASTRPGLDRRNRAIDSVKFEFPSLEAARQIVYEIQCGPRLLEFIFDRDFIGSKGIQARAERPGLPGFVAFHGVEDDIFYPRLILFSIPGGKEGVKLLITNMSGDAVYSGGGSVGERNSEFELCSVRRPGITPVATRVRLTAKGVEISGVSDRRAIPADGPRKMQAKR